MSVEAAQEIWKAVAIYLAAGALFALVFVIVGAQRLDRSAKDAALPFRLVLAPGATLLWPLLLLMWIAGAGANKRDAA